MPIFHLATPSGPACGRQLSNHRVEGAQLTDRMKGVRPTDFALIAQGGRGRHKACRHCQRAVGMLPPVARQTFTEDGLEEEEANEEIEVDPFLKGMQDRKRPDWAEE